LKDLSDKLAPYLAGKRLVIFIDDLDRADPDVVPELLFALAGDVDVMKAWFNALVSAELALRAVGGVRNGVALVDSDGLLFKYPDWWKAALKTLGLKNSG